MVPEKHSVNVCILAHQLMIELRNGGHFGDFANSIRRELTGLGAIVFTPPTRLKVVVVHWPTRRAEVPGHAQSEAA
jgi:hypothetical protein